MCNPLPIAAAPVVVNDELIARIALAMHQGFILPGQIPPDLLAAITNHLIAGVEVAFNTGSALIPEQMAMLDLLKDNVVVFSQAKTATQLAEMRALLLNTNGQLRPFYEFLRDVRAVNTTYNQVYLAAEYEHAVAASQMAHNWVEMTQADALEAMPYLRYDTAGDEFVRPEHAVLDTITKLKTDPFWDTWYPPNGWRCRCAVVETSSIATEEDNRNPDVQPSDIPELFRGNVGKTGVVFPPNHPYFNNQ